MKYFLSIFNGLLVGILAAICILYVFQIKKPYPIWILKTFEKPWVILIIFILGVLSLGFNREAGVLLIIISVALFIDKFLFARKIPEITPEKPKKAPISNKVYNEPPKPTETHGVTLMPLSNTPPGSFPPDAGIYLPIAEMNANQAGLKYYKDDILEKNMQFHESIKPEFGSNYILSTDEYASV